MRDLILITYGELDFRRRFQWIDWRSEQSYEYYSQQGRWFESIYF